MTASPSSATSHGRRGQRRSHAIGHLDGVRRDLLEGDDRGLDRGTVDGSHRIGVPLRVSQANDHAATGSARSQALPRSSRVLPRILAHDPPIGGDAEHGWHKGDAVLPRELRSLPNIDAHERLRAGRQITEDVTAVGAQRVAECDDQFPHPRRRPELGQVDPVYGPPANATHPRADAVQSRSRRTGR